MTGQFYRVSMGKSACHENWPRLPVWAPKSTKSSPKASTSWKFCWDWRLLRIFLLRCLWRFRFPCLRTAQISKITRKWSNFLPNILFLIWLWNETKLKCCKTVWFYSKEKKQDTGIDDQAKPIFSFVSSDLISFAMKENYRSEKLSSCYVNFFH